MTLEEKQQDIIDEFAIYEDWIRESDSFRRPNVSAGISDSFRRPEEKTFLKTKGTNVSAGIVRIHHS